MRKDRNTFFSESNMFQSNYPQMMPGQQMMPNPAPYQQSSASNSFYQGPAPMNGQQANPNMNSGMNQGGYQNNSSMTGEIDSRIAKLERQIRRLETRVNKLESNYVSTPYDSTQVPMNNNNMYMI